MNFVTAWDFAASRRASAARVSAIASARRARIAMPRADDDAGDEHGEDGRHADDNGLVALGELADLIQRARRPRDDRLVAQEAPDVLGHLGGRSVAARFVLLERLRDDRLDVGGQAGAMTLLEPRAALLRG